MAYTKTNWTEETLIDVAKLQNIEDGVLENSLKHNFKGALALKTSSQSLTHNTAENITFQSAEYDEGEFYSAQNPTRLTIPAGVNRVRITASISFEQSEDNNGRQARITKNGAYFPGGGSVETVNYGASTGYSGRLNVTSAVVSVQENDYFEILARHNKGFGEALNVIANETWFSIEAVDKEG